MADRFPSLDDIDAGQINVKDIPAGADTSSFLDRERALLGDDANEFSSPNDHNMTATVADATADDDDDDDDLLGGGDGVGSIDMQSLTIGHAVDEDMTGFEHAFPSIDTSNEATITTTTPSLSYPHYQPPQLAADSEAIRSWRERREADVASRDRTSAEKKEETIKQARTALDDFYETYNDKKEKNLAESRREADEFLKSRDDTTAGGTSWDRIAKLVDLTAAKGANSAVGKTEGKERFRQLLLSLRQDDKAPGASGL